MHPDLIARTCGSIGVMGALIFIGIIDTPKFIITPSQNFESVLLNINVAPQVQAQTLNKLPEPTLEKNNEPTKLPEPPLDVAPIEEVAPEPPNTDIPSKVEPPPTKTEVVPDPPKADPQPKTDPPPVAPIPVKKPVQEPKEQQPPKENKKEPLPPKELKKEQAKPPKAQVTPKVPKEPKTNKEVTNKAKPKSSNKPLLSETSNEANKQTNTAEQALANEASNRKINAQLASLLVKEIRSKLRYPRNAVRRKLEGTVMMEFIIQNGVVTDFKIEKSSGHKILDEAASKLAKSLIKFNTRLDAMSNRVLIPIKYELI